MPIISQYATGPVPAGHVDGESPREPGDAGEEAMRIGCRGGTQSGTPKPGRGWGRWGSLPMKVREQLELQPQTRLKTRLQAERQNEPEAGRAKLAGCSLWVWEPLCPTQHRSRGQLYNRTDEDTVLF